VQEGERRRAERQSDEPGMDVRNELAAIYIRHMRQKGIEPTAAEIVDRYQIREQTAKALLSLP